VLFRSPRHRLRLTPRPAHRKTFTPALTSRMPTALGSTRLGVDSRSGQRHGDCDETSGVVKGLLPNVNRWIEAKGVPTSKGGRSGTPPLRKIALTRAGRGREDEDGRAQDGRLPSCATGDCPGGNVTERYRALDPLDIAGYEQPREVSRRSDFRTPIPTLCSARLPAPTDRALVLRHRDDVVVAPEEVGWVVGCLDLGQATEIAAEGGVDAGARLFAG
jgi:hypothetical protein